MTRDGKSIRVLQHNPSEADIPRPPAGVDEYTPQIGRVFRFG
jgi:hypothetical protein